MIALIVNSESTKNEFRFPYLNGGLFDKAQDFKYDKIALPSEIFDKLFTTFNNYNFTIYEDAPDEHTVAVYPEMLGHIFENLLEDGGIYIIEDIETNYWDPNCTIYDYRVGEFNLMKNMNVCQDMINHEFSKVQNTLKISLHPVKGCL